MSEITPRSEDLQRKVIDVNEHLKVKALKYNLHLTDHSNLQAKSFIFREDKKHFNRSTGVRLLARNIKGKVHPKNMLISDVRSDKIGMNAVDRFPISLLVLKPGSQDIYIQS